jgi:hypothetical protein
MLGKCGGLTRLIRWVRAVGENNREDPDDAVGTAVSIDIHDLYKFTLTTTTGLMDGD